MTPLKQQTHLIGVRAEQQEVKGYRRDDINEEPALEVVDSDLSRMTDHLVVFINIGCPKIDQNVNNEHNIDSEIDNRQWIVVAIVFAPHAVSRGGGPPATVLLFEEEGSDVGGEDCCVDD